MAMTAISAKVDPALKVKLIEQAAAEGKNVNQILTELVNQYLGNPPISAVESHKLELSDALEVFDKVVDRVFGRVLDEKLKEYSDSVVERITTTMKGKSEEEKPSEKLPEKKKETEGWEPPWDW